MKYTSVLDLHTHTLVSGHAYCTLREMARAAADKGLALLGITEHAPALPGTCGKLYFHNLKVVPRELYGVRLLLGTEVNIMDYEGRLDLSNGLLRRQDIVIASMHTPCIAPGTREENTGAFLGAIKNPCVNIIGHPDDSRYPVDYLALVQAAKEYGKVLELNAHSLDPSCNREGAWENDLCMLKHCMKYEVPVVMSSDAHFDTYIGEFSRPEKLLEELDFPQELVLNRSVEALSGYVNIEI